MLNANYCVSLLSVYGKSVDWNRPSADVVGLWFSLWAGLPQPRPSAFLLNRGKRPADDHLTMKRVSRNSSWAGRRRSSSQWTILQLSFQFFFQRCSNYFRTEKSVRRKYSSTSSLTLCAAINRAVRQTMKSSVFFSVAPFFFCVLFQH